MTPPDTLPTDAGPPGVVARAALACIGLGAVLVGGVVVGLPAALAPLPVLLSAGGAVAVAVAAWRRRGGAGSRPGDAGLPVLAAGLLVATLALDAAMRARFIGVWLAGGTWPLDVPGVALHVASALLLVPVPHLVAARLGDRVSRDTLLDGAVAVTCAAAVAVVAVVEPLDAVGLRHPIVLEVGYVVAVAGAAWGVVRLRRVARWAPTAPRAARWWGCSIVAKPVAELVAMAAIVVDADGMPAGALLGPLWVVPLLVALRQPLRRVVDGPGAQAGHREDHDPRQLLWLLTSLAGLTALVAAHHAAGIDRAAEVLGLLLVGCTVVVAVRVRGLLRVQESWRHEVLGSRERLQVLVEDVDDGILVVDPATTAIRFATPGWQRRFGDDRGALRDRVPAAHQACLAAVLVEATGSSGRASVELPIVDATGRPRWCRVTVVHGPGTAALGGATVVVHNVSERRRLEAELLEAAELTELALDATGAAVAVVDARGTVLQANEPWRRECGDPFGLAAPVGQDLLGRCRERGAHGLVERIERALAGVPSPDVPLHQRDPLGEDRHWRLHLVPLGSELPKAVVCAREVTAERRALEGLARSEAELRSLFDCVTIGLGHLRADLTVAQPNERLVELLGEAVSSRPVDELVSEQDRSRFVASVLRVLGGADRRATEELALAQAGPSGDGRIVRVSLTRPADRADADLILSVEDLDELRRAQGELHHAQRLEAVGMLAAGIAHEINTPIQFIGDNVHYVREALARLHAEVHDVLDPDLLDALDDSLHGVARVGEIVQAMRSIGRRGDESERSAVDLDAIVRDAVVVARNEYKYVAEVACDFDELPPVTCVPGDIGQVVVNLLVNAAHAVEDAAHDGLGHIEVRTRRAGDHVELEVADDGVGMRTEVRERAFEPFFTTKEVGRGTGQGLTLVHSIVSRHDGTVAIRSAPGAGTTVTVRLPIHPAHPEPAGTDGGDAAVPTGSLALEPT